MEPEAGKPVKTYCSGSLKILQSRVRRGQPPLMGLHISGPSSRDEVYSIRGWDPSTGVPTNSKLRELGLDDVVEGLAGGRSIGKKQ